MNIQEKTVSMQILQLDETWRGRKFIFRYTTTHYYDVILSEEQGVFCICLQRKPYESAQTKQFDSTLLQPYLINPQLYGAMDGDKLLGFIELSQEDWNNRLRISNILVTEALRFQGIGKALIAKAIEVGNALGNRALVLETQSCNDPAIRFYVSCGFRIIGCDLTHYTNDDIARKEVRLELGMNLEGGEHG